MSDAPTASSTPAPSDAPAPPQKTPSGSANRTPVIAEKRSSCAPCRRAHAGCDGGRPCRRCVANHTEANCIDQVRRALSKRLMLLNSHLAQHLLGPLVRLWCRGLVARARALRAQVVPTMPRVTSTASLRAVVRCCLLLLVLSCLPSSCSSFVLVGRCCAAAQTQCTIHKDEVPPGLRPRIHQSQQAPASIFVRAIDWCISTEPIDTHVGTRWCTHHWRCCCCDSCITTCAYRCLTHYMCLACSHTCSLRAEFHSDRHTTKILSPQLLLLRYRLGSHLSDPCATRYRLQ